MDVVENAEIENCCFYCEHGVQLHGGDLVLCEKKGVVRSAFVCRKFSYDLLKRRPSKPVKPEFEYIDIDF